MKLHLSLIHLISRRQHAKNNEFFLSSFHHPVHPTVPQVSKCPFFKFALSFTSNCFTTSSWWFPKHCHSVPHTKGRLGFTIVSPTSWKHKVPVTKQKKAEGTTASPSTAAVQAAWREQGWPEKPGLEQLCLSVPWSSTFLRTPAKFWPSEWKLAQSSSFSFEAESTHQERDLNASHSD